VIDIGRRTPVERLAHFLLETHARLALVRRAEASSFELPVTQEMISDALGLSVPHLNRTLAQLHAERLIALNEHCITIIDRPAMERLAQFQPLSPARIPISEQAEMH
jgi:CRP-like cAMP-binding protein